MGLHSGFFLEFEYLQQQKDGNVACGDVILVKRLKEQNRTIIVLSDGLGSGIKACVLATMTASMALNFRIADESVERTIDVITNTLPVDQQRQISFASFTIVDINSQGEAWVMEYGNPLAFVIRDGEVVIPIRSYLKNVSEKYGQDVTAFLYRLKSKDRLLFFSDGVTQSGIGRADLPFGWSDEQVQEFAKSCVIATPDISAKELTKKIVNRALKNDIYKPQDDISCGVVYFRKPRKMLICTGPPYDSSLDKKLGEIVRDFKGTKVVSGGTTARIISRELNLEIEMDLSQPILDIPPESTMAGIDLVTEGILTIGRVATILENYKQNESLENNAAGKIVKMLLNHDEINFLVGTKINDAHQDPNLPVELEIRRSVIKRIKRTLEDDFLKTINIKMV